LQVNTKREKKMPDENQVELFQQDQLPQVPQGEINPIMAMIQQATAMSEVDTGKMQALMDMYYKSEDREAAKSYNRNLAKVQPLIPRIVATHTNSQTNSKFAKLEDVNKIVVPIIAEYGFSFMHKTIAQTKDDVTVEVLLKHADGHQESTIITYPIDNVGIAGKVNKTTIHGIASATTYARRNGECQLLNISIGGQDTDGNLPSDMVTEEQVEKLQELIAETDTDIARFCRHFKIDSLADMPASKYLAALGMLSVKKKKEGKEDATA
jgi:hypothetical protein